LGVELAGQTTNVKRERKSLPSKQPFITQDPTIVSDSKDILKIIQNSMREEFIQIIDKKIDNIFKNLSTKLDNVEAHINYAILQPKYNSSQPQPLQTISPTEYINRFLMFVIIFLLFATMFIKCL